MQHLDRAAVPAPPCLGTYNHGADTWDNVSSQDRAEIKIHLETLQGRRCAYCEGGVEDLGQHIEHFRRKSTYPALTFDWNNLFWSCDEKDSCGHFKDSGAGPYDVADLINPCSDDPDQFFTFRADGTISVRHGLSQPQQHKANETLRVFSLHPQWGRLRNMRKAAVVGYIKYIADAVADGFSDDDIHELIAEELQAARGLPFYTAIRHVLTERPQE
ncbi:retron Ec78 anti-phage system effector HNH endonuclease PtuB [Rhizobium sp. YK2]|uniref:retron Ec78 anti-phage system effector HNH endonuclease PtuB n=1 Tax=Rhizobium sp. YK2 TaxID=1860096 RepID=UPI00084C2A60|nr:retron Ec78 anti-phage system effector HNH endonuclease PtuB [Rhizobium sp. YK2]OEC93555.1 TIGR02646 family protein [Rhizobium sp. YK2]